MIKFLHILAVIMAIGGVILLLGGIITIPTVFIPRGKKFEPLLQAALATGQITPELRAAKNDNTVKIAHLYEEVSFIAIAALMVLKPFKSKVSY